ncbi:MAG: BadF/BadG/BcrA/BcrD ATPase family protein [Dysosmobacter welbionis]
MDVILGIDIGGSTTKIVGLRTDGSVISMLRVRAEDQVTSLYGALGNYLTSNRLSLRDVRRVVLTGVGASYVEGDIYGLPTCKVGEFSASGTGALALSGQSSAVVVSMGTGTAFLWASPTASATCAAAASAAALWAGSATSWWEWSASARSKAGGERQSGPCRPDHEGHHGPLRSHSGPGYDCRQLRRSGGGRHSRGPGGRRGEPGAPGHRHHDGAGLPVL